MPIDFYIAMGCLVGAYIFYTWLAIQNLKLLRATKQERLEARRQEKARKNASLRKQFGLPEPKPTEKT